MSSSASHLSTHHLVSSTTITNYILHSSGKTQAHTSDHQKLMKRWVAPPSTSLPPIHPTFHYALPLRLCVSSSFDLLTQCWWFHDHARSQSISPNTHFVSPSTCWFHPCRVGFFTILLMLSFAIQSLLDLPIVNLCPAYFFYTKV
jgi:hypothetical protein